MHAPVRGHDSNELVQGKVTETVFEEHGGTRTMVELGRTPAQLADRSSMPGTILRVMETPRREGWAFGPSHYRLLTKRDVPHIFEGA